MRTISGVSYIKPGNRDDALAAFKSAQEAYCAYGSHVLQMESECMSFIVSEEASPEMIQRTRIIIDSLKKENTSHGLKELVTATLGILLKRAGELEEATIYLENSAAASEKGALQNVYALCLQLADLHYLRGSDETAHEYYRKWVNLGQENGYIYSVPFTQQALQRVLARNSDQSADDSYIQQVVQFYDMARRKNRPENPLNVTFFGPFTLQTGAEKLTEKDFKTRKSVVF